MASSASDKPQFGTFANGCFWGTEQ